MSAYAGSIKAGAQRFAFSAAVRAAAESPADTARVVYEFRDASNENVLATADSGEITTSEAWQIGSKRMSRDTKLTSCTTRSTGSVARAWAEGDLY